MKNEFKYKLLFELYKDKPISPVNIFSREIKEKFGEIYYVRELITDIISYQVEKYGMSLCTTLNKEQRDKDLESKYLANKEWRDFCANKKRSARQNDKRKR